MRFIFVLSLVLVASLALPDLPGLNQCLASISCLTDLATCASTAVAGSVPDVASLCTCLSTLDTCDTAGNCKELLGSFLTEEARTAACAYPACTQCALQYTVCIQTQYALSPADVANVPGLETVPDLSALGDLATLIPAKRVAAAPNSVAAVCDCAASLNSCLQTNTCAALTKLQTDQCGVYKNVCGGVTGCSGAVSDVTPAEVEAILKQSLGHFANEFKEKIAATIPELADLQFTQIVSQSENRILKFLADVSDAKKAEVLAAIKTYLVNFFNLKADQVTVTEESANPKRSVQAVGGSVTITNPPSPQPNPPGPGNNLDDGASTVGLLVPVVVAVLAFVF